MLNLKRYILICCLTLIGLSGFCQNPAHFYIGQTDFSNTHVYSLKHHPNGLLYATTNYGLYVYEHGKFEQVAIHKSYKGNSLFSLALDSKSNLYCTTLEGQIFKLIDDSLVLYTTMPKKYVNKYIMDLTFDDKDNIIAKSRVLAIYKNKKWEKISPNNVSVPVINDVNPSAILFVANINSEIWQITDEKAKVVSDSEKKKIDKNGHHTFPAYFKNQLIGIGKDGFLSNYYTANGHRLTSEKVIVKQTKDKNIWLLSKQKGIQRLLYDNNEISVSSKYFKNQFISCITVSEDGVVYLGTFNKGVIVIPNIDYVEYHFKHGQIGGSAIVAKKHISPKLKGIINRSNNLEFVNTRSNKEPILIGREKLFYKEGLNFGLIKDSFLIAEDVIEHAIINKNIKITGDLASVKDVQRVDKSTALVGTSKGLLKLGSKLNYINWKKNGTGNGWWKYKEEHFRCQTVGYVPKTQSIYYTNYNVIHRINNEGVDAIVMFNKEPIKCSDIFSTDSLAICATHQNGVLFIKEDKIVYQLSKKDGLLDNFVKKIVKHNNKLYIATKANFQIYDLVEKKWNSLGRFNNVIKGTVSDILIAKNNIWLTCGDKIMELPTDSLEQENPFSFKVAEVILGDAVFKESNTISGSYNQNKFIAVLDFRGVLYEKQVKIEYQLNNNDWKSVAATTNRIEYTALAPNNYLFNIRLNNNGVFSNYQRIKFTIHLPFWKRWWFYVLCALFFIIVITVIAFNRIKKLKVENTAEIEKQKLKANLLDTELKALRSQMNPHFIFNSLNSIQDLILKEDTDGSYDYVVLFANLVRNTLNYSNKDFILVENELDFLEVYLKLEKLRFGDEFNYQITYDGTDGLELPSLIVQPFIENALLHGLLHKKGDKNLSIQFNFSDQLTCTIIDNGVGRKKAKEIQLRQGGNHESFALKAIGKRLEILSNKQKGVFGYNVTDLYDNDTPIGTKIVITIPHRLLY